MNENLIAGQANSSWYVMVSRRRLSVFRFTEVRRPASKSWDIVCPPMALRNTSASALYEAWSPQGMDVCAPEDAAFDTSDLKVWVVECDGASSNDRCTRHRFEELRQQLPTALIITNLYGNRQVHLAGAMLFACMGAVKLLSAKYSLGRVLRMNGYFIRLIAATERVVAGALRPRPAGQAPSGSQSFNVELRDFMV